MEKFLENAGRTLWQRKLGLSRPALSKSPDIFINF
jgi:hypothetical protein